jgi:hypothetical protein
VTGFLAHAASTPVDLATVLDRSPDFAPAWAAKALFLVLLGRAELCEPARVAWGRAVAAGPADAREAALTAAAGDAVEGRLAAAADRLDVALAASPGDGLAMKLVHALRFVLGDASGMRRSIEAAAPGFGEDHPHGGYALGCRAFALEETGDYAGAEAAGRAALDRAPDDAWGLHAVAHVHDMTGRPDEGVRWLRARAARWAHCNNFGFHVWWHLALFHIDRGAFGPALALYDSRVRAARTDDYRDIANAVSLLARLSVEGVAVGDRWDELAAFAAARVDDGCNVFADLHYALALGGAGRTAEARRLAERLARDAAGAADPAAGDMARVAAATGAAAADGLSAFAEASWAHAHARLADADTAIRRIGGSHAQRDVFAWLTIEAAMRAGLFDAAERAIAAREARRGAVDGYARRRRAELAWLRTVARPAARA